MFANLQGHTAESWKKQKEKQRKVKVVWKTLASHGTPKVANSFRYGDCDVLVLSWNPFIYKACNQTGKSCWPDRLENVKRIWLTCKATLKSIPTSPPKIDTTEMLWKYTQNSRDKENCVKQFQPDKPQPHRRTNVHIPKPRKALHDPTYGLWPN